MSTLIYILVLVASLFTAFGLSGWTDGYYLISSAVLLLAAAPFLYLAKRRTPQESRQTRRWEQKTQFAAQAPHSAATQIFRALLHASVVWTYLACSQVVLLQFPLRDVYYDAGLSDLELPIRALEEAGSWLEAAKRIETRLQGRLSQRKRAEYQVRHVRDLVKAGQAAQDVKLRTEIWRSAIRWAEQYGVDDTAAAALLAEQAARDALARGARAGDEKSRLKIQQAMEAARQQKRFEAADALLAELLRDPSADGDLRRLQYQNLLDWAKGESSLAVRKRLAEHAQQLANRHGLTSEDAAALIKATDEALAALQLRDLPAGCRVVVKRCEFNASPPLVLAELDIVNPQGQPILGLTAKDICMATSGGVKRCLVAEISRKSAQGSVVLVIDRSASTTGEPAQVAEAGALQLVNSLAKHTQLSAILFDDKLVEVNNLTTSNELQQAFQRFPPRGGTALYAALQAAMRRAVSGADSKRILCFTDGKDMTRGGVTLEQVVDDAKRMRMVIDIVALRSSDFDITTLKTITSTTGGQLYTADHPGELAKQFAALTRGVSQHGYRIAVPTSSTDDRPKLRIGAKHPLEVSLVEVLSKTTVTANEFAVPRYHERMQMGNSNPLVANKLTRPARRRGAHPGTIVQDRRMSRRSFKKNVY